MCGSGTGDNMNDLGHPNIDLTRFLNAPVVHEINGQKVDAQKLMNDICMVTMKIDSDNVEHVKHLTTEGLDKQQRLEFIRNLSETSQTEIFEFSTCNRVLYVGFGIDSEKLQNTIEQCTSLDSIPFETYNGLDVWRHLVKVCSGLDSFMIGELQVMAQFRSSVAWHRKHDLVSDINSSFFDHVISANRVIRKELGFNQTTESMISLASTALEKQLSAKNHSNSVVLGFGGMGKKAVEVLFSLGEKEITVISRNHEKYSNSEENLSGKIRFISFKQWDESKFEASLVISTIRNIRPTFDVDNQLPTKCESTIMDFSWPPSIDEEALHENQILFGMKHWIRAAHSLEKEWDYGSAISKSEVLIEQIENKYLSALTDRSNAKFRSMMYTTLEELSNKWAKSSDLEDTHESQLGPFSREIATWICNQQGPFGLDDLDNMVQSTPRKINPTLLKRVSSDVTETIIRINQRANLSGAKL
tara:strand:+ start:1026 stop:2444 length:1419 start_codon:yes stop_codon:yes gene_type:complete